MKVIEHLERAKEPLISFEIIMGEMRGIMNLCIPFNTIEPLAGKLSANSWSSYTQKQADRRQMLHLETGVARATVEVVVELARAKLTAGELMNLEVGDVIVTEKDQHQPLIVFVEGRQKFEAGPGLVKGHKAIRVGKLLERPQEVIDRKLAAMPPEPAPVQVPGAPGLSLAGPHGAGTAKASKAK